MFKNKQKGLGLSEIMISLMLLSVGAIAVVDIQSKARESTLQSANMAIASNIASDLTGRIMRNYSSLATYNTALGSPTEAAKGQSYSCYTSFCTGAQQAYFDAYQITLMADQNKMVLFTSTCPTVSNGRLCLAVFFYGTPAGTGASAIAQCATEGETTSLGAFTYANRNDCLVVEII